jgi:mannose/cellobiose epimerase-like protein (N-acyl-D-glucosamine 2-epimerase family)
VGAPTRLQRSELVRVARAGVQFLRDHAINKATGHVYFSLARDGTPASAQRKPFSAMFLIMALNEVSKATGEAALRSEALDLMDRVLEWVRTPGALGREPLPGAPALEAMNVPMMVLSVVGELTSDLPKEQADALFFAERRWAVSEIKKHFIQDRKIVRATMWLYFVFSPRAPPMVASILT